MKKKVIACVVGVCVLCGGMGTYAGTVIEQYKTARGTTAIVEQENVHKNRIAIEVDGKSVKTDSWYANDVTYIPLREVSNLLGAKVEYVSKTQTAKITSGEQTNPTNPTQLSQTIKGITIQIDKVIQDSDSLKIYISYKNNTSKQVMTGDSLSKIVASGKQFEYDLDFNFDRYYETNVPHAADFIEPGVTETSVIFFKPISANTINIVLNANFEQFRFNNVQIKK